jgi:histidine triad (HIT) family protein
MAAAQCPFCKIASGGVKATVVYEDSDTMAFLDIRPANPGHTLVITKEHYQILPQLPQELNDKVMQLLKIVAQAQVEALNAEGVNIIQNNGSVAGQVVPHIHFHVIPRFKNDKVTLHWSPTEVSEEQFDEIQKRLSEKAKEIASGEPQEKKPEVIEVEEEKEEEKGKKSKGKLPKVKSRVP